jgi:hypothetical protein
MHCQGLEHLLSGPMICCRVLQRCQRSKPCDPCMLHHESSWDCQVGLLKGLIKDVACEGVDVHRVQHSPCWPTHTAENWWHQNNDRMAFKGFLQKRLASALMRSREHCRMPCLHMPLLVPSPHPRPPP